MSRFSVAALLCSGLLVLGACSDSESDPTAGALREHLALGNPSGAASEASQTGNYLLVKPQYVLSYSRERGIANWVAWHLSKEWLGSAPRQDDFRADEALPAGWYQATGSSYQGSGFDRGHLCPSADRTRSTADNSATFLMTNMVPQAPNNNQRTWAALEEYCRTLVGQGNELYIVAGAYGKGGTGSNGYVSTLEQGRITVPKRLWKVVVVLPTGDDDLKRMGSNTRVIALDLPNDNSVSSNWGSYRTSVDAIEQVTGYDILSSLPTTTQATLEVRVDAGPTQ
ncbi:DNA/RNA non-specific endonuclease [Solirubrum puertoriconensis]|uniref:Endonuclease n=1 Tax=Solirubrum puertoriconensis TaxID=1751427 RepID=A0A9X0HKJ0_SOLP1|nr:DNA/RNA non-specific endonuclease [Solirubrum puertoriconensis]KUG07491.1 DNA/RNA endonuclease [Solirubrum puertoriconensis]